MIVLKYCLSINRSYDLDTSIKRGDTNHKFIGGYVVKTDPKNNNGLPFRLFKHRIRDGKTTITEEGKCGNHNSYAVDAVKLILTQLPQEAFTPPVLCQTKTIQL
jgi:hypothetical protein